MNILTVPVLVLVIVIVLVLVLVVLTTGGWMDVCPNNNNMIGISWREKRNEKEDTRLVPYNTSYSNNSMYLYLYDRVDRLQQHHHK